MDNLKDIKYCWEVISKSRLKSAINYFIFIGDFNKEKITRYVYCKFLKEKLKKIYHTRTLNEMLTGLALLTYDINFLIKQQKKQIKYKKQQHLKTELLIIIDRLQGFNNILNAYIEEYLNLINRT